MSGSLGIDLRQADRPSILRVFAGECNKRQ